MYINIILFITLFLYSCVPASPRSGVAKSTAKTTTTTTKTDPTTNTSTDTLYWYAGQKYSSSLPLTANFATSVYLRGSYVENFLKAYANSSYNYAKTFCLKTIFTINTGTATLYTKAVPIVFTNTQTNVQERVLRIDFADKTGSQAACSTTGGKYSLSDITTLRLILGSTSISLLSSPSTSVTQAISFLGKAITLDTTNNSSNTTSTCSNSYCKTIGTDCCLNNQCVIDKTLKGNASSYAEYNTALADVATLASNYIKYPNIYNVCSTVIATTPSSGTGSGSSTSSTTTNLFEATKALEQWKCYYACLVEGTSTSCGAVSYNSSTSDFTCGNLLTASGVQSNVNLSCSGCSPTGGVECINYSLAKVTDSNNKITDIKCVAPSQDPTVQPLQTLDLAITGRIAPHRLFNTAGFEFSTIASMGGSAEGSGFSFGDEINNKYPNITSFSMGAILGKFESDSSEALPAKVVSVEKDNSYFISTTSGNYTPCPSCRKDAWLEDFSKFVTSRLGFGLESKGYATSKDTMSDNFSLGNAEDTMFGRACFVPPTMIIHSNQVSFTNAITNRALRLETQSARFFNGYQRDWYGFNYGAVIGSFDGVTWFAIGPGRRVTATSNKLFLAINAPFADLASIAATNVSIRKDISSTEGTMYDYHYALTPDHRLQNRGASCQYYHKCETDTECVTKLGWEYMCADVSTTKTYLPVFDNDAKEIGVKAATVFDMVSQFDSDQPKRCVYRGAGSLCSTNLSNIANADTAKLLTCAPNFYCATSSLSVFNTKINREPFPDQAILGQGMKTLGRPENYTNGSGAFTSSILTDLQNNFSLMGGSSTETGICVPGKAISTDVATQDTNTPKYVDSLNQIGACDSSNSATMAEQVASCPFFDETTNNYNSSFLAGTGVFGTGLGSGSGETIGNINRQNACGSSVGQNYYTIFNDITLPAFSLTNPATTYGNQTNACLRRAGAACFTDNDCSPNKLHGSIADFASTTDLKNQPEKEFWSESLICGQSDPKPLFGSPTFYDYDLSKNRCCRETGKTVSMYTQIDSALTALNSFLEDQNLYGTGITTNVQTWNTVGPLANQYSRYSTYPNQRIEAPYVFAPTDGTFMNSSRTLYNQWKAINDTGSKTCCGGSWVRLFSDGTNNWSNTNRLQLDVSNFKCLNYMNELDTVLSAATLSIPAGNLTDGRDKYCVGYQNSENSSLITHKHGCTRVDFETATEIDYKNIVQPNSVDSNAIATLYTAPYTISEYESGIQRGTNLYVPYIPEGIPLGSSMQGSGFQGHNFFMSDSTAFEYLSFQMPYYITGTASIPAIPNLTTQTNITNVEFHYYPNRDHTSQAASGAAGDYKGECTLPLSTTSLSAANEWCMYKKNSKTYLLARADEAAIGTGQGWGGLAISFRPLGTNGYSGPGSGVAGGASNSGITPGNDLYYLERLSRLELLGVPQIVYEPIYCNANRSKLVPGIFSSGTGAAQVTITTRTQVAGIQSKFNIDDAARTFFDLSGFGSGTDDSTGTNNQTPETAIGFFQDGITLNPIFSNNQTKCCRSLGSKSLDSALCCSGYAVSGICKIPSSVDLNVYFNKFISSEGTHTSVPEDLRLSIETDFIQQTGEPKINTEVQSKVFALGQKYCGSGQVERGEAFFQYENAAGSYYTYSIIDQPGLRPLFSSGKRWNHHFYCQ